MLVQYKPWGVKNSVEDLWGIEILEGEFAGTILSFNDVKFDDDNPSLILDYTIIKPGEGKTKEEIEGESFNLVMNSIMTDVLTNAMNYAESEYGKNNTAELNSQ